MVRDDLARARRWGSASGIGIALRTSALVDSSARSVDRLREAADVLEGSPARLEHARALTDLGAALRRANRRARSTARAPATGSISPRTAAPVRSRTERERNCAPPAASRAAPAVGVEQLTASERRVAELAAQGHSNPEIAQALFVTRKTVETHLGRVYRKLGISGRAALGRALPVTPPEGG